MAPAASCREGVKRLADSSKSQMTLCQNVKTAPARTAQTGGGGNRTEMCEPRAPKGMQDESREPIFATLCCLTRNGMRLGTSPASAPRGNGLQKGKRDLHAGGLHPEREKPSEALFFPSFCTRRNCLAAEKFLLCGRQFISLRKAILFLSRKNTRRDGEMLHTDSFFTRFLTVRLLLAACRPVIETRKRKENLSS